MNEFLKDFVKVDSKGTLLLVGQPVQYMIHVGVTWFLAQDIVDILGLESVNKLSRFLEPDEKLVITNAGKQVRYVNESGLIAGILTSKKEAAREVLKAAVELVKSTLLTKG